MAGATREQSPGPTHFLRVSSKASLSARVSCRRLVILARKPSRLPASWGSSCRSFTHSCQISACLGRGGEPEVRSEGDQKQGNPSPCSWQRSKRLGCLGYKNLFITYRSNQMPPPPGTFSRCAISLLEPPEHIVSLWFGDELWEEGLWNLTGQAFHVPSPCSAVTFGKSRALSGLSCKMERLIPAQQVC